LDVEKEYRRWVNNVNDPQLLKELENLNNNENEKHERFHKSLEFGTAGLRGLMGAGTNRVNIFTVRKVSQGFAAYILKKSKNPSAVISYDSRNNSKAFAEAAAEVMMGNGIKTYISKEISPTPFLSFAVRNLGCTAGIMITASHNPKEYNGYKCYTADGAQVGEKEAKEIYLQISSIDIFKDIKLLSLSEGTQKGLLSYICEKVYKEYLDCAISQRVRNTSLSNLSVVYTPLNGCGMQLTCEALKKIGINNLKVVKQQEFPDGNFTSCPSPNPERLEAFTLALEEAKKYNSDLVLATDPDADRLGVCLRHEGEYKMLTGNQIGILLFYYLLKNKKNLLSSSSKPIVIKTLVSSKMINAIAQQEGCAIVEVFTGFKNIAEKILELEQNHEIGRFLFGFEESNGYLCGTYARDKDAISAAILISEAAAYFKSKGLTLLNVLDNLSEKYGYYTEESLSFEFKGAKGSKKIANIMLKLRKMERENVGRFKILKLEDYSKLHQSNSQSFNMISFIFGNENEIIIRPSGTEPKLKVYIMLHDKSKKALKLRLKEIIKGAKEMIEKLSGLGEQND